MDSSGQAPPLPASHRELLSRWPSYAHVSRVLEAKGHSITGMGVARWAQNDSVPGEYWHALATCADEALIMGFTACLKMLAEKAHTASRERRGPSEEAPQQAEGVS